MVVIAIEESEVEARKKSLENRIEDTYHLYSKIKRLSSLHNINNFDALVNSVGNFFSVLELLSLSMREQFQIYSFDEVMPLVLSVSANYALDTLGLKLNRHSNRVEVKQFDKYIVPSDSYPDLKSRLMNILSDELDDSRLNVAFTVGSFFEWASKKALSYAKSDLDIVVRVDGSNYSLYTKRKNQQNNFKLTWNYFGGYENIVKEFKEIAETIKDYNHVIKHIPIYRAIPKGILLAGPPGTGKTYLSRIFCETSNLPYIEVSASDVGSTYTMGLTLNFQDKVDELISEIRSEKSKFGVFYIDELDAVAQKRGLTNSVERDTFVSVLNSNMDGPKYYPGVIFIASTNRPDIIDPALLRPGRFREYKMGPPSINGVKKIFEAQISMRRSEVEETCYSDSFKKTCSDFVDEYFSPENEWTGAFVNQLLNRAERDILYAHRHNKREFNMNYKDLVLAYKELGNFNEPEREEKLSVLPGF